MAVYCGSSDHVPNHYLDLATEVGACLASQGIGVVYGGGHVGLMGRVADAAMAAGGHVTGVITQKLLDLELGHEGISKLEIVETMAERKGRMLELADAFIALPGGVGTLEEIFEAATLTQLHYQLKPVGLLNAFGYYDHLIDFLRHCADESFIRPQHRELILAHENLDGLLQKMGAVEFAPLKLG
ncbi:MAG TPA: TIGR00730 family Rossman fold protein [Candidatus Handelsmanbacteria bacterium]|nr:TIGR00730 family Rossman fold protein [Candidatus Handelsmanbacteria bacterium]